jgi:hypothetical protein
MTGSRFLSSFAILSLLFVVLGFTDGWASAARQCLGLSYVLTFLGLVSVALASSLREAARDRFLWTLGALTVVLGLVHYFLLGPRSLYYASLLGVVCGAILGLGLRFGMSRTGRRLERSERRILRKITKRLGFGSREET